MQAKILNRENEFQVVGTSGTYTVTLEAHDWQTGAHDCTCPDAARHPGRYCKHILFLLQRIQQRLPAAIIWRDVRHIIDAGTFTYYPDPQAWSAQAEGEHIEAHRVFYWLMFQRDNLPFKIAAQPRSAEEIILAALTQHHSALVLAVDAKGGNGIIRTRNHETIAVTDAGSIDDNLAILAAAGWYPDRQAYQHAGTRYTLIDLVHGEPDVLAAAQLLNAPPLQLQAA